MLPMDTRSTYPTLGAIKWVRSDAKLLLQLLAEPRFGDIVLVVALEREVVNRVQPEPEQCASARDIGNSRAPTIKSPPLRRQG